VFMTPKEAARIRAKKATTIPCPKLVEFEKQRMALEKAVKEDEKRAEKREKLLQEMRNATKEVKTTSKRKKTDEQKGEHNGTANVGAETNDENKSSLQAVREAKEKIAQLDKEAKRAGSAGNTTETGKPTKKDKKEKKEKKATPQSGSTPDADKVSKSSARANAEATKSEHSKKDTMTEDNSTGSAHGSTPENATEKGKQPKEKKDKKEKKEKKATPQEDESTPGGDRISKSSAPANAEATKSEHSKKDKTTEDNSTGSAHGSTPENATEKGKQPKEKKDKKEKKEQKATPQEDESTADADKVSKSSAPANAEATKSEHSKKDTTTEDNSTGSAHGSTPENATEKGKQPKEKKDKKEKKEKKATPQEDESTPGGDKVSKSSAPTNAEATKSEHSKKDTTTEDNSTGSAHGSTPENATEKGKQPKEKKDKKEKKEKKATPQEDESTPGADKISKSSAPAIAEATKSEHSKKDTTTEGNSTGSAHGSTPENATEKSKQPKEKKDKKEKKEKKATPQEGESTPGGDKVSKSSAPAIAEATKSEHSKKDKTTEDNSIGSAHGSTPENATEKGKQPKEKKDKKEKKEKKSKDDEPTPDAGNVSDQHSTEKPKSATCSTLCLLDQARPLKVQKPKDDSKKRKSDMLLERQSTLASIDGLLLESPLTGSASPHSASSPPTTEKKERKKVLTEEEKAKIQAMQKPSEMPYDERKRQYAAMRRAIYKDAKPELVAKFSLANDKERFQMLKSWVQNQDVGEIDIEEKYVTFVRTVRTDRYTTVTIFQLEKIYGKGQEAKAFIQELCRGQAGVPHPQAPNVKKARMYKVLREVVEENQSGTSAETSASLSGRVRDGGAKQLLAKQLQGLNSSTPEFMNLTTGQIRCKKPKKEKSPVDEAIAEMKKISKKWNQVVNELPKMIKDLQDYNVRNCSELVTALDAHEVPAATGWQRVETYLGAPASEVDPMDFQAKLECEKNEIAVIMGDISDAKRRLSAAKGPKKGKGRAAKKADPSSDEAESVED
ncbi:unnamed protein product, partial [Cladocopium goreaui]